MIKHITLYSVVDIIFCGRGFMSSCVIWWAKKKKMFSFFPTKSLIRWAKIKKKVIIFLRPGKGCKPLTPPPHLIYTTNTLGRLVGEQFSSWFDSPCYKARRLQTANVLVSVKVHSLSLGRVQTEIMSFFSTSGSPKPE